MASERHQGKYGRINNELAWSSLAVNLSERRVATSGNRHGGISELASKKGIRLAIGDDDDRRRTLTPLEERVLAIIMAEAVYGRTATESVSIDFIVETSTPTSSPLPEVEHLLQLEVEYVAPCPVKAVPLASTPNRKALSVEECLILLEESREAKEVRGEAREERRLRLEEMREKREERQEERRERESRGAGEERGEAAPPGREAGEERGETRRR